MKTPLIPQQSETAYEEGSAKAMHELAEIRRIIHSKALEKAFNHEQQKRKDEAQQQVSDVFSEAMRERQQQDASVSEFLVPIVSDAVHTSITQQRSQFIDSLYPMVGELVRKFTSAFLRDFIEKTNEAIEKSVTLRSFAWRFKAWRAGVSYSRYVASQTYVYQVQQVMLVHHETGTLLHSLNINGEVDNNSDLVSAMLTAIDDFISDSFSMETSRDHLDEIKTDNFTLYVRKAPKAYLVAAVTGNISPKAKTKLQTTLEYIHTKYLSQLSHFDGNTAPFDSVRENLAECLLEEEKLHGKKRKPIFALIAFSLLAAALAYFLYLKWNTAYAMEKIALLPPQAGIVVSNIRQNGIHDIRLTVLRDPRAVPVNAWLSDSGVNAQWININEIPFISLAPQLTKTSLQSLARKYDGVEYSRDTNTLKGVVSETTRALVLHDMREIAGIVQYPANIMLKTKANTVTALNIDAVQHAMTILSGEIVQLQLTFDLASSDITAYHSNQLQRIVEKFNELQTYARQNQQRAKLLILGTSDNVGSVSVNRILSYARAENTKRALVDFGLAPSDMLVSGLGVLENAPNDTNVRKAIINVIYNPL